MCSIMLFYLVQSSVISPTTLLCIPRKTAFQDHLDYGTHGWPEEVSSYLGLLINHVIKVTFQRIINFLFLLMIMSVWEQQE